MRGMGVRLVNLRTLKPLDQVAVLAALQDTSLTVTVEDHFRVGGLFSIVAELCLSHGIAPRVLPLALDRWYRPGRLDEVLETAGFTGAQIADRILGELREVSSHA